MKMNGISRGESNARKIGSPRFVAALLTGTALTMAATPAMAQDAAVDSAVEDDVIVITGIRSSLQSALNEKRNADSLVEVIQAEDIGKLPDQNLAEVLENVTGVQITRRAGVGSGVQIRGTNDNRTEINGVGTVGPGTGRGGISFEDINAAIISAVEVTKAPTAQTIEGSVGGTINLRTIRPLDLKGPLIAARAQGEYSELSDSITPRLSASFGNVWQTGAGEFGIVLSGSYAEQEATSFRPRLDRDGSLVENNTATVIRRNSDGVITSTQTPAQRPAAQDFDFLGIQFLNQEIENFEYTTYNFAGTLEWAPSDNVKFYFDTIYNDQERRQDSSRNQASGVSNLLDVSVPTTFQTVNFGSLDGVQLGSIQAAETGTVDVNLAVDNNDPNLRFSSDTGARLTTSEVYRLGTEFETGRLSARIEASRAVSNTTNPNLSVTTNLLNPKTPIGTSNDNAVPFRYDLSGGALRFGIDTSSPFAPTTAELLDPANLVLEQIQIGRNSNRNKDDAFRIDTTLDVDDLVPFFTSFDVGYRYNKTNATNNEASTSLSLNNLSDSPSGTLFAELLVAGPDNFGSADGRDLFFSDFLVVDPDRAFNDPDGVLTILRSALAQAPGMRTINDPSNSATGFFSIDETTHAVYGQANFEAGVVRGNLGLRWVDTRLASTGNSVVGNTTTQVTTTGGYTKLLPRINVVADLYSDIVIRGSFGQDINRPDFDNLSTSVSFGTSENAPINIGNPRLSPETVTSYDASVSWYFAPSSVLSVGVFHKKRDDLIVNRLQEVTETNSPFVELGPNCTTGIFNPRAQRNQLASAADQAISAVGICVPTNSFVNDTGSTTQTGVEVAFQYDLSQFEDTLGFASGFGLLANYTYQETGGGDIRDTSANRGTDVFNAINGIYDSGNFVPVTAVRGLLDFSKHAFNVTTYYEKYGFSARLRYTWRDKFRTLDTAAGASLNSTLGFPVVTEARGQLNGSLNYDITDNINIGVEGVNLTKSKIRQYCVNDGALLCAEGLPDRRLTFGASFKF